MNWKRIYPFRGFSHSFVSLWPGMMILYTSKGSNDGTGNQQDLPDLQLGRRTIAGALYWNQYAQQSRQTRSYHMARRSLAAMASWRRRGIVGVVRSISPHHQFPSRDQRGCNRLGAVHGIYHRTASRHRSSQMVAYAA